jgi:hypothetical protein
MDVPQQVTHPARDGWVSISVSAGGAHTCATRTNDTRHAELGDLYLPLRHCRSGHPARRIGDMRGLIKGKRSCLTYRRGYQNIRINA